MGVDRETSSLLVSNAGEGWVGGGEQGGASSSPSWPLTQHDAFLRPPSARNPSQP